MIKKSLLSTLGGVLLFTSSSVLAATYTIDTVHSSVGFSVKHLGISRVTGQFDKFEGTVDFDPQNIAASKATANIDLTSVNTSNQKRDDHLRACDFFCVEKFGQMTFTTKSVKPQGGDKFQIVGDLTLHGVTKEVVLDATFNGKAVGPDGTERAGFSATGTLNRKDFGLTWSKLTETGGIMVGDEVTIKLEIEAVKTA